ncbi:MAG: YraN family protein [Parvularculaceae bacterium]|nr:YraN family protein [Parvularculaceae bacterium]
MRTTSGQRIRAERSGRAAETLAAWVYRLRGYEILDRRFQAAGGEIDLVARKGSLLAFVEVKRRAEIEAALFAVSFKNRRRMEQAVKSWLARRPRLAQSDIRYDIAAVAGWRVEITTDAWREGQ